MLYLGAMLVVFPVLIVLLLGFCRRHGASIASMAWGEKPHKHPQGPNTLFTLPQKTCNIIPLFVDEAARVPSQLRLVPRANIPRFPYAQRLRKISVSIHWQVRVSDISDPLFGVVIVDSLHVIFVPWNPYRLLSQIWIFCNYEEHYGVDNWDVYVHYLFRNPTFSITDLADEHVLWDIHFVLVERVVRTVRS